MQIDTDLTDARLISAAQEMREAVRYLEVEAGCLMQFGAWPENRAKAQRFIDALAAWDALVVSDDRTPTGPAEWPARRTHEDVRHSGDDDGNGS